MKRKLTILMASILLSLTLIPYTVLAEAIDPTKYGEVTDISKSDSVKSGTGDALDVTITGSKTANVIVDYGKTKGITLKYLDANESGRVDNVAWLGIHVSVPSSITKENARYTVNGGDEQKLPDDGDYYLGITEANLKKAVDSGKPITYTYVFKYSQDITQKVTVNIYPQSITLLNKDNNTIWSEKDAVPKTGDSYPIMLIALFTLSLCAGAYNLTQAYSKK